METVSNSMEIYMKIKLRKMSAKEFKAPADYSDWCLPPRSKAFWNIPVMREGSTRWRWNIEQEK